MVDYKNSMTKKKRGKSLEDKTLKDMISECFANGITDKDGVNMYMRLQLDKIHYWNGNK